MLTNRAFLIARTAYLTFFANSLFVASVTTVATFAGALAGYSLSRDISLPGTDVASTSRPGTGIRADASQLDY
jgi:ABC-type glycerol-3-phosphate transport system permease component